MFENAAMTPAIVIIAFNRPLALGRLLTALDAACYDSTPNLVISLDGEALPDVIRIAESFKSKKFTTRIIYRKSRMGLREHVLACGDLTEHYNSVILLEDDILIDHYFYLYAGAALNFYRDEKNIAGIALYNYEYNELANLPFEPIYNGFDTYLMQVACSSGQCWTREQWVEFRKWYSNKTQKYLDQIERLPPGVKSWPESSWKKYFHGFMVETDKYFVYPYQAYSTNCSDHGGEHIKSGTSLWQVGMAYQGRQRPAFHFCPALMREVLYDSFMEPCGDFVYNALGKSKKEIEIDLYGTKPLSLLASKTFSVTIKKSTRKIKSYSLQFRPHEFNLLTQSINGDHSFRLCESRFVSDGKHSLRLLWVSRCSSYCRVNIKSLGVLLSLIWFSPNIILNFISRAVRKSRLFMSR